MPKPSVVVVGGCPCEVLEDGNGLERGVAYGQHAGGDDTDSVRDASCLCVAPDGTLVLAYEWESGSAFVSFGLDFTEDGGAFRREMVAHLERLARALAPAPRGGR